MATLDSCLFPEDRKMPPEVAQAVLPATLVGYVLPAALISLVPLTATGVSRSTFNVQSSIIFAFLSAPVTVSLLTMLVSRVMQFAHRKVDPSSEAGEAKDKPSKPPENRSSSDATFSLTKACAVTFAIQAAQHLYTVTCNVIKTPKGRWPLATVFAGLLTHATVPGEKYSTLALYAGATLSFCLYTVWDLRRRGMVTTTDTRRAAIGIMAGQVLFGPGATYAGLWWWREIVLAKIAPPCSNSI